MARIAILAFGSLIDEPGKEICPIICERIQSVRTPFSIEFARSSRTRGRAPTLIPVDVGGSPANAVLLVLDAAIGLREAKSLLWRRETRKEFSGETYSRPSSPSRDRVVVECLRHFHGCDVVLYTNIGANIEKLNADHLADLAIRSARGQAGVDGKDGISYLASMIHHGVTTPLLSEYRDAILRKTKAGDLYEAHKKIRKGLHR